MLGSEVSAGTDKTVEAIGKLPPDLFSETCQQVVNHLAGRSPAVDAAEISVRYAKAGISLDLGVIQDMIRVLSYQLRSACKNDVSADQLVAQLGKGSSKWSRSALQAIHTLWSEEATFIRAHQAGQALSVGQLLDVKWKLAMAVSSDTCRALHCPYVTLTLKFADASGQVSSKTFEMTLLQFQNFFKQFKEMAAVLETV